MLRVYNNINLASMEQANYGKGETTFIDKSNAVGL